MSTYEVTSRSAACREALTLIANRHNLFVYFDYDKNEVMKSSLNLSEGISYHSFELIEKDLEERIKRFRSKLNSEKGENEMNECHNRDICKNVDSKCINCKRTATDYFEPTELSGGMCLCVSCRNIITDGRIFPFKDNPRKGLCFKCY